MLIPNVLGSEGCECNTARLNVGPMYEHERNLKIPVHSKIILLTYLLYFSLLRPLSRHRWVGQVSFDDNSPRVAVRGVLLLQTQRSQIFLHRVLPSLPLPSCRSSAAYLATYQ